MRKRTLISIIIVILLGMIVILGVLFYKNIVVKKDPASSLVKEKLENTKGANADKNKDYTDIVLYFGANGEKAEIIKEERLIGYDELLGEIIMQELIKGPATVSQGKPVIPKETRLISFSISDGIGYVNLSSDVMFDMTAVQEETLLKAIAASLAQLESVDKVMLNVDSQTVESIGGNYNVSKPFNESEVSSLKISK